MKHFTTSINISACQACLSVVEDRGMMQQNSLVFKMFILLWLFIHSNQNNRPLLMKSANAQETCNLSVHIMTSPLGQLRNIHLIACSHCNSCCLFLFIPLFLPALTGPFMFLLFKLHTNMRDDLRTVYIIAILFVLPSYFHISGH